MTAGTLVSSVSLSTSSVNSKSGKNANMKKTGTTVGGFLIIFAAIRGLATARCSEIQRTCRRLAKYESSGR